jgi:hypothetical protein
MYNQQYLATDQPRISEPSITNITPATMQPSLQFKNTATARALFWMGVALIGVFSATVLAGMLPLGLLLPAWQSKVSNLILATAHLAGIGAILILLAQQLDDDSENIERWVGRLRLLAIPAAIGFFLLLPLLTYNGYKLLRTAYGEELQAIGQLQKTLASIKSAKNEAELRAAVSQIPGAPPNLGTIKIPLPQAIEVVSRRFGGEIKKMENQAEERNARRWQGSLIAWARNCFISLCYGAGFAEIARFAKARSSVLFSILSSLPWSRRMRAKQWRYRRDIP